MHHHVLVPLVLLLCGRPATAALLRVTPQNGASVVQCVPTMRMRAPEPHCTMPVEKNTQASRVAALIAVPLAWGTYGPAVKLAYELQHVPPAPVLQASFQVVSFGGLLLAGAVQALGARREEGGDSAAFDVSTAFAGAELGLWLFLGQALQLQGLQRTDAARAGFFVQLTTVLVPLAEAVLLGRKLPPRLLAACASATAGIAVISADALQNSGGASVTLLGDALVAASALLYTTHVIRLGEYASSIAPLPLARAKAGAQLFYGFVTVAVLSAGGEIATGDWAGAVSAPELRVLALVALWNGLIPSAFTTWAQTYGQVAVSPSAANVLYSFQPVWNAGIAALVLGETIDAQEIVGGSLIVLGAALASQMEAGEAENAS